MLKSRRLLLGSAIAALLLVPADALAGGATGTTVTVRVEGAKRTLLAPRVVHTHAGSITKGGAPAGSCPASSAAGALDRATHGDWQGKVFSGTPGIFVTSIFGEKPTGNYYWTIFTDGRTAQQGICALRLHRGEQLLFAVTNGSRFPIVLSGPARVSTGRPFTLTAVYYRPTTKHRMGIRTPLAGASVGGGTTNRHGLVTLTAQHSGRLTFTASRKGYIRSAPVTVAAS